ncbi:MAG TPA: ABC transporter ATP-binding protein [Gaiellaceae bacterium]|nr:ABC transporter ATP-binding protein [Gaiellaceae bacterium]
MLEARSLSVAYGPSVAVAAVSLALDPGKITGLAGESGSGKTTLALSLAGYPIPGSVVTGGRVLFGGRGLHGLSPRALRELWGPGIAYLPQDASTALNPALRISGQLLEALRAHGRPGSDAAELIERVGLRDPEVVLRRYPHELSGGEQQRVALALAIACDPDVLLLDEPTTGLDRVTQARVVGLVETLTRELQTATLLVSHDLPLLATVCDQLYVMYQGEIVEHGSAGDVLGNPKHPHTVALVEARPARSPRAAAQEAPILSVDGLRCAYGPAVVFDDISFALATRHALGVAGESGSGKTTLLRAIAGLIRPAGGEITLAGRPLTTDRSRADRQAIQIVFQNPDSTLNPRHTVMTALNRPLVLFRDDVPRAGRRDEAARTLERLELSARLLDRLPRELSAGQRQRVAIARALIARPQVLLCDEITSALDRSVQAVVIDLLSGLRSELAIVFVSHDRALLDDFTDEIVELDA